jgi:branched-subunit amino acid transport protein
MTLSEAALVLGMALVTFAVRYPALALITRATLPPRVLATLKFVPPAVLTALIVPALLAPDGDQLNFSLHNDFLVAGLVTMLVAWRSKNLLLTLGIGMLSLWGYRLILAWLPGL